MPILFAPLDKELTITHVGGDEKILKRLHALGMIEGAKITVLSKANNAVIVIINNTRLAIGSDLTGYIMAA
ncbi:MAG: ferrous iron transport protein A [Bacilli bacterium]|nr:ferrous iron transport protein A [Bacilli bacterium]